VSEIETKWALIGVVAVIIAVIIVGIVCGTIVECVKAARRVPCKCKCQTKGG